MAEPTETAPAEQPARKASIEDRIAASLAPEPAPTTEAPTDGDEAVREAPERRDPGPAEAPEAEAGAPAREPEGERGEGDQREGESQELEIGTLAQLAEHIGVEVADLYQISVPLDVDGKKAELSIGEWKDKVRTGIEADALAEQRKAFVEERQAEQQRLAAQHQALQTSIAEAAALTEAAEKRMMQDLEGIDWAKLRSDDPAEWAAKQQEIKDRQTQIQEAKAELARQWQAQAETLKAEQTEQLGKHLEREREALLKAIPEWRDESAFESERKGMREYLSGQGFADEEIDQATDHRLILMARKAMLYDQEQAKQAVALKKVAKVAKKIVRPGAATGKQAAKQDALDRLQGQLKKSGRMDDAAALIAARLKG